MFSNKFYLKLQGIAEPKMQNVKPGKVADTFSPTTGKAEAEGLQS